MEKAISKALGKTRGSKVVGSNPAGPTTRQTDPTAAKIFKTLWTLKKNGQSEDTLKAKGHRAYYACLLPNEVDTKA